jgi:NDP-sugar pyrophosphorylase family protein
MLPVAGQPLLQHVVQYLKGFNIRQIVINLHHHPEVITDFFGDGSKWDVEITYSWEPELLGTAGAVKKMASHFTDPFLVVYGDNLTNCRIDRLTETHTGNNACATVALFRREDVSQSGVAEVDAQMRISRFVEKPAPGQTDSHWVNAGVIMLQPEVLDFIPANMICDFGRDILPLLLAKAKPIYGYSMSDDETLRWIDTPEDYRRVCGTTQTEGAR